MASARPVSGEIMTGPQAGSASRDFSPTCDVVDAEYEVLDVDPVCGDDPVSTVARQPARHASAPPPSLEGMAMLRPAGAQRLFSARGGPLFWAAGLAAALGAFWVSGGHAVIRHSAFADAWSGAGPAFSITGIASRVDTTGLHPVLLVDGEAGNDGAAAAALPPLEIQVTGDDGVVTRYTLGTSTLALAPGQKFAFSSRLDVPRNGVHAVSVSFAE